LKRILNKFRLFKKYKKRTTPSWNINVITCKKYLNNDAIFGIIKLEDDVYASAVILYPSGTINKLLKGKKIKAPSKIALIEVGTEVKFKYKEIGAFSPWPDPTKVSLVYRTMESTHEIKDNDTKLNFKLPADFVLLLQEILPNPKICYEEEGVVRYLKNKLQDKIIQENKLINLNIAGFTIRFKVLKTIPSDIVIIKPQTYLSFIRGDIKDDEIQLKVIPKPPDNIIKMLKISELDLDFSL